MRVGVLVVVALLGVVWSGVAMSPDTADAPRKKVGLVLSGGGAKGAAHISVLRVLEEAEIPIDYIAGTSMGAIVGGLMPLATPPTNSTHLCAVRTGSTYSATR